MKNGLHIENLTEEYVTSYEDVIQILIKVCTHQLYSQSLDFLIFFLVISLLAYFWTSQ